MSVLYALAVKKLLLYVESAHLRIAGGSAELLLDAEKLVVLRNSFGSAGSACLDLAGVECNGKVSDSCISSFTGTM